MACMHDQISVAREGLTNNHRFLLPALQIQTILEKTTRSKMRQTIDQMSEGLDDTFQEMLNRVKSQGGDRATLSFQALMWISNANRKLKVEELRQALAIKPGDESLDEDDLPIAEHIVHFSCGLVVIDQNSSEIRLMHALLQEYLEAHQKDLFAGAHEKMACVCLTALTFGASSGKDNQPESMFGNLSTSIQNNLVLGSLVNDAESAKQAVEARLDEIAFLRYAAIQWGHHERKAAGTSNTELAFQFLGSQSCLRSACQIGGYEKSYKVNGTWRYRQQETREALHTLAFFGLDRLARIYLEQDASRINNQDSRGNTALIIAAREGHLDVVKVLDEFGADIRLNKTSMIGAPRTALVIAASRGNDSIVEYLIKRQFGEQRIYDCTDLIARATALQASAEASISKHLSTVELFRNAGCDVISESSDDNFLSLQVKQLMVRGFDAWKDAVTSK